MKIKLISIILSTALLITGCSSNKENAESQTNTEITSAVVGESSVHASGNIDFEAISKNISINGKSYSMPFCCNNLSDEFRLEGEMKKSEDVYYLAKLIDENGKRFAVEIKDDEANGQSLNIKPITAISVNACVFDEEANYYYDELEERGADISFNGVRLGMTSEEIKNVWGEPESIKDEGAEGTVYSYYSPDRKMTMKVMIDSLDLAYSIIFVNHSL